MELFITLQDSYHKGGEGGYLFCMVSLIFSCCIFLGHQMSS